MTTQAAVEPQSNQADGSTEETQETLTKETPTLEALQTQLAEQAALIAKQANDLKARDGQRRKQSETDNLLADLADEARANRKLLSAYVDALYKGETDHLPDQVNKIEQESEQSTGKRQRQARYEATTAKLSDMITGEAKEGEEAPLLLTEAQAAEVQKAWTKAGEQAFATGDFGALHDVILDASKMVRKNEREAAKMEKDRLAKEAKEDKKTALEKAGVYDLSTGPSSGGGGGGITSWTQAQKIKQVSDLSDADYAKLVAG